MLPLLCLLFTTHFSPPDNGQTYKDSLNRYSVSYPANWDKKYYENAVAFFSPLDGPTDQFDENVNVIMQDLSQNPMTLAAYTELSKNQYKKMFGDSSVISIDDTLFDGQAAKKGVCLMTYPKQSFKVLQYWFIKNNMAYLLTYTAEPAQFDRFLPTAMKVIDSFTLLK